MKIEVYFQIIDYLNNFRFTSYLLLTMPNVYECPT